MIIWAPADAPIDAIQLPDPALSNEQGQRVSMQLKTARDGTQHTYIYKTDDLVLNFSFTDIGRGKIVELQEFLKKHAGEYLRVEDHRSLLWRVQLLETDVTATMDSRAAPILETGNFDISFVGQQYA